MYRTLTRTLTTSTRSRFAMTAAAASDATLHTYLAILPDFEEGSKRLEIRSLHLANSAENKKKGLTIDGGAIFSGDAAKADGSAKMAGSWMLVRAENLDKAREYLEKDIYATGGAWDMSKAQIMSVAVSKK